ncbi:MAG: hypothetical protein AB8C02_19130 [Halioglobus sp.]
MSCTHPIEITGEGDVISLTGERDCILEAQPCNHIIAGNYIESYTAQPRDGYSFSHWEGCLTRTGNCNFYIGAATVREAWGATAPPLRAVFLETGINNGNVIAAISASRTTCVSPCTVVFSAENTTDTNRSAEDSWQDLGYHFNFDDPGSGSHATTGLPRNEQLGGPLAAHTFVCTQSTSCTYSVGVRAQNPESEFDDAFINVSVEPASVRYSATATVCVSGEGNFIGCPEGAAHVSTLPTPTGYDGRRILLRRGETFEPVCIDYSAANVLVEPFGAMGDGRPEVTGISGIGVDRRCLDHIPNDLLIGATDGSSGYPQQWANQITLTGLRMTYVAFGMSYTHVSLHDIDMLHEDSPTGGAVSLVQNTRACLNSGSLSCENVPYPVGAYLSAVNITQSEAEVSAIAAPFGVNIGAFNCPIINWLTVLESTARNSIEHNFRSEGTWRAFHGHNVLAGHHHRDPPGSGVRQKITIRACGAAEIDPETAVYRHNTDDEEGPMTRYTVIADNILGSVDDFGFGARLTMAPTQASSAEVVSYGIAERNTFLEPNDISLATDDGRLSGYNLACRNNTEATPGVRRGCIDTGQNAVPAQWYTPAALEDTIPPLPLPPQRP